jgi:hypothetical protein
MPTHHPKPPLFATTTTTTTSNPPLPLLQTFDFEFNFLPSVLESVVDVRVVLRKQEDSSQQKGDNGPRACI